MPETTAVAAITTGLLGHPGGGGAQQSAHRSRPGPGGGGHPPVPGAERVLGGARRDVGAAQQRADDRHRVVRAVAGTAHRLRDRRGVIDGRRRPRRDVGAAAVVAFGSAFVPEVASFIAGQAAFTMMVLIIFNLIAPTGWSVGLIRIEDVMVGALVGVVVSVLLWPRGRAPRCRRPSTRHSPSAPVPRAAVLRVTRGASEEPPTGRRAQPRRLTASRDADDAVRQYLSESSGPADIRAPVVRGGQPRGPAARRRRTDRRRPRAAAAAVPTRSTRDGAGGPRGSDLRSAAGRTRHRPATAPISDDFVIALRAEAADDELAGRGRAAAGDVAAALGELELLYPEAIPATRRNRSSNRCGMSASGGMAPNLPAL